MRVCEHKDQDVTWILYDARSIPIGRVCPRCVEAKKATYRPEVLTDPNYEADEPIEEEL